MENKDCKIKKWIADPKFDYVQPWFYSHTFALRCELGMGEGNGEYMRNARNRAFEIFDMLFQRGVDAAFLDHTVEDCSVFEGRDGKICRKIYRKNLDWFNAWKKYPHQLIVNVPRYDSDGDDNVLRVNRLVCFFDGNERIDFKKLIVKNLDKHIVHLVSYENECIFSVYDDRGCDIVFADKDKYVEFYDKLKNYLLPYDLDRMTRVKEGNMFIGNAERKKRGGSAFYEFQFCRREGDALTQVRSPYSYRQEDSLYFHMDYEDIFDREYREIFQEPTNPDGGRRFDPDGVNYYTKEQTQTIIGEIKARCPFECQNLLPWLERAAEYNGFYLMGL